MTKINKRVHYSYDHKGQTKEGYIDLDLNHDDEFISDKDLQKYVGRKWDNTGYKGWVESIQLDYIES